MSQLKLKSGPIYMCLAALTMNLSQALLRIIERNDHSQKWDAISLTLSSSVFKYTAITLIFGISLFYKTPENKNRMWWIILIGLSDAIASIGLFWAGFLNPLAINNLLGDLHMLFVPAFLMLKNSKLITSKKLIALVIGLFAEAIFVLSDQNIILEKKYFLLLPIGASVMFTLTSIYGQKISGTDTRSSQISVGIAGIIFSLIVHTCLTFNTPGTNHSYFTLLSDFRFVLATALAVIAQITFLWSLTSGDIISSLIAAPAYTGFGGLIGWIGFNEHLSALQFSSLFLVFIVITFFTKDSVKN